MNYIERSEFIELFEKKFEFRNTDEWSFNKDNLFGSDSWSFSDFQEAKQRLNDVKSRLEVIDSEIWRKFTDSTDLSALVVPNLRSNIQPELLTRAWAKFYEILHVFPELIGTSNVLNSLHLSEAPGAFIAALNHFLVLHKTNFKWTWQANSLEPFYEGGNLTNMIIDDRLIHYTRDNWNFGFDGTGDLTVLENCQKIITDNKIRQPIMLITADGSVDCHNNPQYQEETVCFLQNCETITALSILAESGCFVLKIFTVFEHQTINLMYLINCCFKRVIAFKPFTSKSGNSEIYIICLNFNKNQFESNLLKLIFDQQLWAKSMFAQIDLPESFLTQLRNMNEFFNKKQIKAIENNLQNFHDPIFDAITLHALKIKISNYFVEIYQIAEIPKSKQIVQNKLKLSLSYSTFYNKNKSYFSSSNYYIRTNNFHINLTIGKTIENILCSRYCEDLSNIHCFLDSYHNKYLDYFTKSFGEFETVLCYNNDYFYNNQLLFNVFLSNLNNFKESYDFVLIDFVFLTRFHFGLLFLISHCFEYVKFHEHVIILKKFSFQRKFYIDHFLSLIKEKFDEIAQNYTNQTILNILHYDYLFKGAFYHKVFNYNSWILNTINS